MIKKECPTINSQKKQSFFLHSWGLLIASIVFIIITFLRQPSAFINPQFTSEDGRVFFKDAYDNFNSLRIWFQPPPFIIGHSPFIELSARIGTSVAYLFSMLYIPFIIKLMVVIFKILPAIFFLSNRCNNIMQNPYHRLLSCIIYILLPNQYAMEILLLNSRWYMGILAFLIFVANPAKNTYEQILDYALLLIACLSGVFVICIFPLTCLYFFIKKELLKNRTKQIIFFIFFICFCTQLGFYIHYPHNRDTGPLGATISHFLRIFGGNFVMSGLVGEKIGYEAMTERWWNYTDLFPILFSVIGFCIMLLAFLKTNIEGKLFFILSIFILSMELISPLTKYLFYPISWENINLVNIMDRYYFYPTMVWILSIFIVWFKYKKKIALRILTSLMILCFLFIGVKKDFFYIRHPDYHTKETLLLFDQAPKGTIVKFMTDFGIFWDFTLEKH